MKTRNKSINYAPTAPDSLHCASFQLPVIEALDGKMNYIRIIVTEADETLADVVVESNKRLTGIRAARVLAREFPGFMRGKGRYSSFAGVEILPVVDKKGDEWHAWRLSSHDKDPSGFQPPVPGRVGKLNSRENPYADLARGVWQLARISELPQYEIVVVIAFQCGLPSNKSLNSTTAAAPPSSDAPDRRAG